MFNFKKLVLLAFLSATSIASSATGAGNITSLRFTSAPNGKNYAVITTSTLRLVPGTSNYVGAENNGVPYTLLLLPSDPTLCALAGASLERARSNTSTIFYFLDVKGEYNYSLGDVPGIPSNQYVNIISNWHLGQ
jgi:hypothetical protein